MVRRLGIITAALVVAGAAVASALGSGALPLGPVTQTSQPTYVGYYDGHKDVFLATDTSNKAQAHAMHINYSAAIRNAPKAPPQYFIMGRAAQGQLSVFGSEPGESDYNPLWDEIGVTWNAGVTPVLLVRDDQIKGLAKKGMLKLHDLHTVLNAPITKIEK